MTFKVGSIVAEHYELKKQLGQGSFGDVWLAHNMLADMDVAIKFYGTLDQKGIEEFRNEFKIAYRLHHPNLLNISHFDVFEDCPYLVMPYCENGSVSQRIGQMPESEIWKFVLDVSCGLTFLHNQEPAIVHQDIKPDNILITSDGRYVISDFGISRSFRTMMSRTNNKVNSSGTLAYMGPERFSEKPMVVLASDIWAFGMTLYEVITGDVLWEGMGGCVQLNGARIPPISDTTPELARLVSSCLAAETWNRPTSQQIYDYAAAHIQHKQMPPITYLSASSPTPEPAPVPAPAPKPTPAPKPASEPKPAPSSSSPMKRRLMIAALTLLGIIAIGAGAAFFFNNINEEQDFISCKTREDYEQFIKNHPTSSYVATARKRIETLTPSPQTEATRQQTETAKPTETVKKTVIVEKTSSRPRRVADDRINILPSKTKSTATSQPLSHQNDNGAQATTNQLMNLDDNIVNNTEPSNAENGHRARPSQNLPPRGYQNNPPPMRHRGGHYGGGGHFRRP